MAAVNPWGIDVAEYAVVDQETLSARCRAIRDAAPSVADACAALDEFVRAVHDGVPGSGC